MLDSAEGKNDGAVAGVRYFECAPNCGLFVKRAQVKADRSDAAPAGEAPHAAVAAGAATADSAQAHSDRLAALRRRRQSALPEKGSEAASGKDCGAFSPPVFISTTLSPDTAEQPAVDHLNARPPTPVVMSTAALEALRVAEPAEPPASLRDDPAALVAGESSVREAEAEWR